MTKINVVTAVDHAQHLTSAHESLKGQTLADWEWTIVPLGTAVVPDSIADDPHVVVGQAGLPGGSLGHAAAKKAAFERGSADYVFDLDQSDTLATPGVLARMVDELAAGSDLVYGDFQPRWLDIADFDPVQGWQSYTSAGDDDPARIIRAFDPDASSLHLSVFAPRHGLLWRRTSYIEAGGHTPDLGPESDFDLLCRAYVAGAKLTHVSDRTVVSRRGGYSAENPELAQHVSNTHVYALIRAWSERSGLQMLDLGAAHNPAPGFTSVDLHDAEINCDIRFGLPVPDSSIGCIRAQDFLEHMNRCPDSTCQHGADGGPRCAVGVMNEFYRVLAPGGWLTSGTPSSDGRGAYQDPTHVSFWNPNSFWYYTRREQARFVPGITCRFQGTRIWQTFPNDWHREHNIPYVYADLVALKGQRQPGICEI